MGAVRDGDVMAHEAGDNHPPLPPKDLASFQSPNLESYFKPLPPSRPASIYSVNRASLSQQLAQLTSIALPDADSLASTVAVIPTAPAAAKALSNAAGQIKSWIKKAAEVLGGLDAEDDVEWAGSGNKEGLSDVEAAIKKFEKLVVTYITSVEEARKRKDIHDVSKADMTLLLDTLDDVVNAWAKVTESLKEVKRQVELAMEWEELWNTVLGEIGQEIEELGTVVFEMEEKRYKGGFDDHVPAMDIKELETIVEEAPTATDAKTGKVGRFNAPPKLPPHSPLASPGLQNPLDDSSLLTLFARMQPLRASLDFLPMRLSSYETRAKSMFPSACAELENRRKTLEAKYKELEKDAETLREELGEDRWVSVFRNAARQAQKMCESVERAIFKLQEALETDAVGSTPTFLAKRVGDYEAKKNSYGPAVKKVLSMIEKGTKERLTLNGEVIRIHSDTRKMWNEIEQKLAEADAALEEAQAGRSQQLRDSVSTIMSTEASGVASTVDTPGSSPASSVALAPMEGKGSLPSTPDLNVSRSRGSSIRSLSSSRPPNGRRVVSQPALNVSKRAPLPAAMSRLSSASPSPGPRASSSTPTPGTRPRLPSTPSADNRPRWSVGTRVDRSAPDGPKFKPSAYATALKNARPSVYSFRTPSIGSALPSPSPLGPGSASAPPAGRFRAASSLGFHGRRDTSPSPSPARSIQANGESRPKSRLYRPSYPTSTPKIPQASGAKRTSLLPVPSAPSTPLGSSFSVDVSDEARRLSIEIPAARKMPARPASSMAFMSSGSVPSGRRSSMLPTRRVQPEKEERRWKV